MQVPDVQTLERPLKIDLEGRPIHVERVNLNSQPPYTGSSVYNLVSTLGKYPYIRGGGAARNPRIPALASTTSYLPSVSTPIIPVPVCMSTAYIGGGATPCTIFTQLFAKWAWALGKDA